MDKQNQKVHWSHAYLKRINSTEVTVRREKLVPEPPREVRAVTLPVLSDRPSPPKEKRTPERVVGTPVKSVSYLTPNKNLAVPQTPNAALTEECMNIRSRKRLFW